MAGPLTLGAAPEILPHSSHYHQSQIGFIIQRRWLWVFSVMLGSVPYRVFILYASPSVFIFPSLKHKIVYYEDNWKFDETLQPLKQMRKNQFSILP